MDLITNSTNLDYLITPLRLQINDTVEPYTYSEDLLRTHLVYAAKALGPRWNYRYLVDADNNIVRNTNHVYLFPPPPTVQNGDERAIVLQASINIKSPIVYTSSQNTVSWKDDEVSYSNVSGNSALSASLERDIAELEALFPSARKRLAQPIKQSLPGFEYEG